MPVQVAWCDRLPVVTTVRLIGLVVVNLAVLWRLITVFLYHGGRKDFHLIYKLSL
ncbi:hypothetical protein BGX33_011738 [Mortierella sp. NVP41]|nr:hypothetical protein BGX33_011738 [Mortierella sp. NVP41]